MTLARDKTNKYNSTYIINRVVKGNRRGNKLTVVKKQLKDKRKFLEMKLFSPNRRKLKKNQIKKLENVKESKLECSSDEERY